MNWLEKWHENEDRREARQMIGVGVAFLIAAFAIYAWEYWV